MDGRNDYQFFTWAYFTFLFKLTVIIFFLKTASIEHLLKVFRVRVSHYVLKTSCKVGT